MVMWKVSTTSGHAKATAATEGGPADGSNVEVLTEEGGSVKTGSEEVMKVMAWSMVGVIVKGLSGV
jgi:hypothetical protein